MKLKINWPWMSRKKHEEVVGGLNKQMDEELRVVESRNIERCHQQRLDLEKRHEASIEAERMIIREAIKHLRPFTNSGYRVKDQPAFVVQTVVDLSACQWMRSARDTPMVVDQIVDALYYQLREQFMAMTRCRGMGEFLMQLEQGDRMRKEQNATRAALDARFKIAD